MPTTSSQHRIAVGYSDIGPIDPGQHTVRAATLAQIRHQFASLPLPGRDFCQGFFAVRFIGPFWLRHAARPSIALSGMPGWQGKRFLTPDRAINVLTDRDGQRERLIMRCEETASLVDGRPTLAFMYGSDAPRPWRWIRDEFRVLDSRTLLAMTIIDLPLLRGMSFPFLLERR